MCYKQWMTTAIALILKPIFAFFFFCLVAGIKLVIARVIPDGRIKNVLFREYGKKPSGNDWP